MNYEFFPDLPHLPQAACKDIINPDLFFPETKEQKAKRLPIIRALCGGCIEKERCLEYAVRNRIADGYWGGKSPSARGIKDSRLSNRRITKAHKIRELAEKGRKPEQIAALVGCQLNYVLTTLERANTKGVIQSRKENEQQAKES